MSAARVAASVPPVVHLPALDGVRGLAVVIVIVHNAGWIAGESEQVLLKLIGLITTSGWIGVQLFFALSGFLITGILLDSKGKLGYFRSFYLRRTLRIFPLYYAVVASTVLIATFVSVNREWAESVLTNQWAFWVYLSNWVQPFKRSIHGLSHLWSLAVEEQFYLLWPLVVWLVSRRGLIAVCLTLMAVTPFIRLWLRSGDLPLETAYLFTIARWDALAAGALIAALHRDGSGRLALERWTGWIVAVATVALALLVARQHGFHSEDVPNQVIGQSLIALLSAGLIVYAVDAGPRAKRGLQRILSTGGLRTLGKYSYAMYVFHFPIHHALKSGFEGFVVADDTPLRAIRLGFYLLMIVTLSFLAAQLSWRVIEKPFLDLKDRIAPRAG